MNYITYDEGVDMTLNWDYEKLLVGIAPWSTNERYPKIIFQAIIDNQLP